MKLPNLATLSLEPRDTLPVGVYGDQCDPRKYVKGKCVRVRPSPRMFQHAREWLKPGVNEHTTSLLFRIHSRDPKWHADTPVETMYNSGQWKRIKRNLDRAFKVDWDKLQITLGYYKEKRWKALPDRLSWQRLVDFGILPSPRDLPRGQSFELSLDLPANWPPQSTAAFLHELFEYNIEHPPFWFVEFQAERNRERGRERERERELRRVVDAENRKREHEQLEERRVQARNDAIQEERERQQQRDDWTDYVLRNDDDDLWDLEEALAARPEPDPPLQVLDDLPEFTEEDLLVILSSQTKSVPELA